MKIYISLFLFHFMISFGVCIYINISLMWREINSKININTWVDKKKIKSSRKEYVLRTWFKFWPMKNIFRKLLSNESLIMVCLQIYRELLLLVTFLRVHSNSKEVSYLCWQIDYRYPNLKATCHIKLKFFLWTEHPAKYLISVTSTL